MSQKSGKSKSPTKSVHRQGEGYPLSVRIDHSIDVSGESLSILGVDIADAPVPDRKYVADVYAAIRKPDAVLLVFGQSKLVGSGLRSAVIVHLSESAVLNFLQTLDADDPNNRFVKIAQANAVSAEPPVNIASEPDQAVMLKSNLIFVAMSKKDACIDFYHASPAAVHVAPKLRQLSVDPVVRVDLRASLLLGIVNELKALSTEFAASFEKGGL